MQLFFRIFEQTKRYGKTGKKNGQDQILEDIPYNELIKCLYNFSNNKIKDFKLTFLHHWQLQPGVGDPAGDLNGGAAAVVFGGAITGVGGVDGLVGSGGDEAA